MMLDMLDLSSISAIGLGILGALGGVIVGLLRSHSVQRSQVEQSDSRPIDSRPIDMAVDEINRSAAQQMDQVEESKTPGSAAREARRRRNRGRNRDQ